MRTQNEREDVCALAFAIAGYAHTEPGVVSGVMEVCAVARRQARYAHTEPDRVGLFVGL
jgi:hypothetical protein